MGDGRELTIEWEFELRKDSEEGSGNGEKKKTPVDLLYISQTPYLLDKVHYPEGTAAQVKSCGVPCLDHALPCHGRPR